MLKLFFIVFILVQVSFQYPHYKDLIQYQPEQRKLQQNCQNGQIEVSGQCVDNDLDESTLSSEAMIFKDVGYKIKWGFPDQETITFFMEIGQKSWMAFGIGSGMSDADVIYVQIQNDSVELKDGKLTGYSSPSEDSTQDLTLLGYSVSNNKVQVKFNRKLDTQDNNDEALVKGQKYKFVAAYSNSNTIQQHALDGRVVFDVTLDENQNLKVKVEGATTVHKLHVLLLLISWGVLVDVGILIVLFLKNWRWYMWIHASVFFLVDLLTLIFGITKATETEIAFSDMETITQAHFLMGCVFMGLMMLQHIGGAVMKFKAEEFSKRNDFLGKFKKGHKYNGIFLYVFGKVQIIMGAVRNDTLEDTGDRFKIVAIVLVVVTVLIQILAQLYLQMKKKNLAKYVVLQDQQEQNNSAKFENKQLLDLIQTQTPVSQIQEKMGKGFKYALLGNRVFQLNNFMHPGGNYIIQKVLGREIDRFFFGGYALEGDKRASYIHSSIAERAIIDRTVGILKFPEEQNILNKSSDYQLWKVVKIDKLSPTTSSVLLENSEIKMKNYNAGVEWFGRYFQFKSEAKNKRRLYTTIQCMNNDNVQFRKKLVELAQNSFAGEDLQSMPQFSDNLVFVIKKYTPYDITLSSIIHNGIGEHFVIKGPLGIGLGLNSSSSGKHVLVTGGTGILPFLDLLNFLLQKVIYEIAKNEKGEEYANSKIDVHNIGLKDNFNQDFSVILYSSFIEENEFLGRDIIQPLAQLCSKYESVKKYFKFVGKFRKPCNIEGIETTNKSFNAAFFEEQKGDLENVQKLWVCGPPGMNSAVPLALKKIVSEDKIQFI